MSLQHAIHDTCAPVVARPGSHEARRKASLLSGTALSFAFSCLAGLASSEARSQETAVELDTLTVEGRPLDGPAYRTHQLMSPKYTKPLLDTPQSVTVVPEELMQEQGTTTLRQALQNVPGISMQAGEGNPPGGDSLKIRGFSARDDFYMDGMHDVGSYVRDTFNMERIEVVKGPASAFTGRGSTGGTIDMISKMPGFDDFVSFELTGGGGWTENSAPVFRGTIDVNQTLPGLEGAAVRVNAMGNRADVPGREYVENDRWGFAPSISFGLDGPTQATIGYFHMSQSNMPDYGIPTIRDAAFAGSAFSGQVAPVDYANFYGYTARDYEDIEVDQFTVNASHAFSDGIDLEHSFRYGRLHNDSAVSAPRIVNNTGGQITDQTQVRGQAKFRDQVDEILINQTDLTLQFNTGSLEHTVVTGLEYSQEWAENNRRLDANGPNTLLFDPDPNLALTAAQLGVYNGTRARLDVDTLALYVSDTIDITEQWSIGGALRWDRVDTRVRGFDDGGTAPGFVQDVSREDEEWSWRTGLVYKPVPIGSIYASYGTSFQPVASLANTDGGVVQLAGGNNAPPAQAGFFGAPEETQTYEVGTKWDLLDEMLTVNAAVFRIDKLNARDTDPVTAAVTVDGKQRVDGFEIGLAGNITEDWRVFGAYTFLDSEILESNLATQRVGSEIDNTPRNSFNIWTSYDLTQSFTIGGGAFYVGQRTNQANNAANVAVTVDSYVRFDAMAEYRLTDAAAIRLNVINLTDETYIDQLGGGQAVPGQRLTALLSTTFRF